MKSRLSGKTVYIIFLIIMVFLYIFSKYISNQTAFLIITIFPLVYWGIYSFINRKVEK